MSTFPLEPQIRRRGTGMEWDGGGERLIKDSRRSVKCARERDREWGREREMRRLIFGCDLKQLFLCGALKMDPRSFPSHPATLFMLPVYCLQRDRELLLPRREKENQCHCRNQSPQWRIVVYKRMQSCKCLLLLLFCKDLGTNGSSCTWNCFFRMTLWQQGCCFDTAGLTLSRKSCSEPPVLVAMWRFWLVVTNRRLPSVRHSCRPHMRDRGEERRGGDETRGKSMYVDLFCSQVSEGNCCVTEASVTQSFVPFLYLHVTGYASKYKHTSSHKHQSTD